MKKISVVTSIMLLGFINANAIGTAPSTAVNNTATLSYDVGGVTQTSVDASDAGFVVDRKIDLTVANDDPAKTVDVTPSQTGATLNYTIVNTGNDTETFDLTVFQADGSNGLTDDFDPTSCLIYNGATPVTQVTLDSTAGTNSVALTVQCTIPDTSTVANGNTASLWLVATVNGRTNNNADVDDPAVVQNVFADDISAGSYNGDTAQNGDHSDSGTYNVVSADLTMVKTSIVTDDPVYNGGAGGGEPHRIPGATVRYCFDVENTGGAIASNVVITDDFTVDGKSNLTVSAAGNVVQASTSPCDCAAITDTSGNTGTTNAITTGSATLNPNERACGYIEATIN